MNKVTINLVNKGKDYTKKMPKNCPSLAYFARKIYMQIAKTNL